MRQRLFYKPPRKLPRVAWGTVLGFALVFILLRAGFDAGVPDRRWVLPLGLSLPAGAIGGYLYALLDPMRARGQGFIANVLGVTVYLVIVSAALAVGLNSVS